MRRALALAALTVAALALSTGSASASECMHGPDLSKFGIYEVQVCHENPLELDAS